MRIPQCLIDFFENIIFKYLKTFEILMKLLLPLNILLTVKMVVLVGVVVLIVDHSNCLILQAQHLYTTTISDNNIVTYFSS